MSLAMTHASSPDYWVGALGMVLAHCAEGRMDQAQMRKEYKAFWESPLVQNDLELRAELPPPTTGKGKK